MLQDGARPHIDLDPDWLSADTWVGLTVDSGDELTPRNRINSVPIATVAHTATHVPTSAAAISGSCSEEGEIVWDATVSALQVCAGGTWQTNAVPGVVRHLGSAIQTESVEHNAQSWVDLTGTDFTFTVPAGVTTRLTAHGSVTVREGPTKTDR